MFGFVAQWIEQLPQRGRYNRNVMIELFKVGEAFKMVIPSQASKEEGVET